MSTLFLLFMSAVFISIMIAIFFSHMRIFRLKESDALLVMPLEVSPDIFRDRFDKQIEDNSQKYFHGKLFSENKFFFQYIVAPTPFAGTWITLRGIIYETEIRYDVSGKPIYQGEKVERERLVNKLRELCAPEPGITSEAE